MSRRSKRLCNIDQEDDRISTSSVESHLLYRESPGRTTRRKVASSKSAPTPHQTTSTYYSETSTYVRGGLSAAIPETDYGGSTWGGSDLVRKRMGMESSYNTSNKNGFSDIQTAYDKSTSSSGYSSEEDYIGQSHSQEGSVHVSHWRRWTQQIQKLSWLLVSYPGHVLGLLYWWVGTTWYRLTTSAALLDVFILTRHYNVLKKVLLVLLLLLFMALMATGLWHLYPFRLRGLISVPVAIFSGTEKSIKDDVLRGDSESQTKHLFQTDLDSRMKSLEMRFQGLENEHRIIKHAESGSKAVTGLSRDEAVQVFKELSSSKEAALREGILQEGAAMTKSELRTLREEQQNNLKGILQKMQHMSKDVEDKILQLRTELKSPPQENLKESFLQEVGRQEAKLMDLQQELEAVKKAQAEVSQQIETIPGQIRETKEEVQSHFPSWLLSNLEPQNGGAIALSETFLRRDERQNDLVELEKKILAIVAADKKKWTSHTHRTIDRELQAGGISGVSREEVYEIVNLALQRYSEDRIGMVDYALESSGASVLNTRCSETYETKTALLSLFGVPLWYQSQSPRVILQPDLNPGNCWAFQGAQGYAVIRLSSRIRPTAVTLDHIPLSLSPKSTISSAPKDFSFYGLEEEAQKEGILLGNFTYNQNGDSIQTFPIQGENISTYDLVELRIQSNWGHPEYTCIYRFRVHGEAEL
ncbi:SUN domain-containing protein 2 isoform X1 [Mixophyes fleayi]|uniref:SUN domain-containing protein 2 isoform X1 n=1 Tax=Mixophyes fleayi TaxID=3061075 RepID=UPI003F4DB93A